MDRPRPLDPDGCGRAGCAVDGRFWRVRRLLRHDGRCSGLASADRSQETINSCVAVVNAATLSMPTHFVAKRWLNVTGLYYRVRLTVDLGDDWVRQVGWLVVSVLFRPQWANPLWKLAGTYISSEKGQIQNRINTIDYQRVDTLLCAANSMQTAATPMISRGFFKRIWRKPSGPLQP